MDGKDRTCLPYQRKGMQRPGKIENVWKKIHARARKLPFYAISNFVWANGSGRERFVVAARNSAGEKGPRKDE